MKRSEINSIIKSAEEFIESFCFKLPPWTGWSPESWKTKGHEYDEIRDNMLGWDVTDYGQSDFNKLGLVLITIRNGNQHNPKYAKPYAEKVFIIRQEQVSPMHFHWEKMEDIVNRGGGNLVVKLYNKTEGDQLDEKSPVRVNVDGRSYVIPAGGTVTLKPGESVSLDKLVFHEIFVEPGTGDVFVGEISQCNDDNTDNFFLEPLGRFAEIEEDEPAYRLLCNEYPTAID